MPKKWKRKVKKENCIINRKFKSLLCPKLWMWKNLNLIELFYCWTLTVALQIPIKISLFTVFQLNSRPLKVLTSTSFKLKLVEVKSKSSIVCKKCIFWTFNFNYCFPTFNSIDFSSLSICLEFWSTSLEARVWKKEFGVWRVWRQTFGSESFEAIL